jgi:signal transduction histidine kinase
MASNVPHLILVDEGAETTHFDTVTCPALRSALREVSVDWSARSVAGPGGEASLNAALMHIALRLGSLDEAAVVDEEGIAAYAPDPQTEGALLKAVRQSLFDQWRREELQVSEDRIIALLYSIDRLIDECGTAPAGDLAARLGQPDAFQLVAEVAHDLRSPLTSILFLSEAMRTGQSGSLTELQQRQLGLIYSAALGLTGVANDLMTSAKDKTGGLTEEPVAFSLHDTFESVREMVTPMAEAKDIELGFGLHCFGHRVGHPGPLGRIVLNLTTNAIKFTDEGGSVDVLAYPVGRDRVEISVQDTGRGMAAEDTSRLFEAFQKSPGREGYFFAASGLGLSIVKRLLSHMDSDLSIESEVGKGTRFSFALDLPRTH